MKILMTGVWPKGQVCYMVLWYGAAGMMTDILLSPTRGNKNFRWTEIFSNIYYGLLAFFCLLLYGAIGQRIAQYGITENRYFVVLLGTWTLCMALYFFIRKSHVIKLIPITLFSVLLLSSFGPWSAFSVSKQHQYYILETVLEKHNLLKDGVIAKNEKDPLSHEDRRVVSDIVDYLYETHGIQSLQPYFSFDLQKFYEKVEAESSKYYGHYDFTQRMLKEVGITYIHEWSRSTSSSSAAGTTFESFNFLLNKTEAMDIRGYGLFIPIAPAWENYEKLQTVTIGSQVYQIMNTHRNISTNFVVMSGGTRVANFNLLEHFQKIRSKYAQSNTLIPASDMLIKDGDWALLLQTIDYDLENGNVVRIDLTGWLLRR